MDVTMRKNMVAEVFNVGTLLRNATDSRPLLQQLKDIADKYIALEDVPARVSAPPPPPRVEQGGVNRMEPESTPTVTRKKKSSE